MTTIIIEIDDAGNVRSCWDGVRTPGLDGFLAKAVIDYLVGDDAVRKAQATGQAA